MVFQLAFDQTSSPSSARTSNIRLFNVTDAVPTPAIGSFNIGRDADATNAILVLGLDVTDTSKTFRFEIGGGDAVTGIDYTIVSMQAYFHGRLGGLVLPAVLGF
jgi:hypothetical protein